MFLPNYNDKTPLVVKIIIALIMIFTAVAIVAAILWPEKAHASEVDVHGCTDDSVIVQNAPTTNYGSADHFALYDYSGQVERDFVKFSTSDVPAGATVTSAVMSIYLYEYEYGKTAGKQIYAKRVTQAWSEGNITWNNQPSVTDTGQSSTTTSTNQTGWIDWDVTGLVQDAIANRGNVLSLRISFATESGGTSFPSFYSSEYSNSSLYPILAIQYTGGGTPTPSPTPSPSPVPDLIVAIGDSLTYGYCDGNNSYPYPDYLESLLDSTWTVTNKGVNNDRTDQMLDRFQTDVLNSYPSFVIIWGGVNDLHQGYSVSSIEANLQEMYSEAHNIGAKVIALTVSPAGSYLSSGQNSNRISLNSWVMYSSYNVDYRVDISTILQDGNNTSLLQSQYDCGDGVHLNALGYQTVANSIYSGVFSPEPTATPTPTGTGGPTPTPTGGVTVTFMDTETVTFIVMLVVSIVMSFLSLRIGAIMWFITGFAWLGVLATTDNDYLMIAAGFMAVLSELLFISGASRGRR